MEISGEIMSDETIMNKVMWNLSSKFDCIVVAIEEWNDLIVMKVEES